MDENKNLENLDGSTEEIQATEEVVEETVEATPEESVNEEIAEETPDAQEESQEAVEATSEEVPEAISEPASEKKSKAGVIVAIVLVVAIVAAACVWFFMPKNKYNKMGYVDISGKTVQDLADQMGIGVAEFLEQYQLPSDMPADTTESAAYYNIPVKVMAQMFGMDYATMKETLHFPETVTEDTTWGEAEGEVLLKDYVGEDNLDAFKEQYGFGDEVTLETKWKEVRYEVDMAQKVAREEQEKAMAEAEKEAEADANAEEPADAPAEEQTDVADETPAE